MSRLRSDAPFTETLDRWFGRLALWSSQRPLLVVTLLLGVTITGGYFATTVHIENGFDSLFNDDDPVYDFYQAYQVDFYPDESIYLLYHAPDTQYGPFDIDVMRQIAQLTETLEREVPFVRKVTSLANAEFVEATGDLLEIHDLAYDFPDTQTEMLALRDIALSKPMFVDNLINADASYGAIVVDMTKTIAMSPDELQLDPDGGSGLNNLYPQVAASKLEEILARPEYAGIMFYPSGDVPYNAFYNRVTAAETPVIALGTFGLIALIAAFLFPRGLVGLSAPLMVVLLAIVLTIGFIGWLGWSLGFMFTMIPTFICAIGVSQAVHVLLAYQKASESMADVNEATRVAIEKVGTPCFLAAITTAIGLLGMTTSSIEAIAQMAVYAAFGVLASFVLSLTLIVSLSVLSRKSQGRDVTRKVKPGERIIALVLRHVVSVVDTYPRAVLLVFGMVLAIALLGVTRLEVDYNFIEELDANVEVRRNIEQAESVMGGFISAVYIFDTGHEDGIKNIELLRAIEAFTDFAEAQPLVRKAQSIVEITKDLNQALHGDDTQWYVLPDDPETLGQLLFLYQMSGGEEINDFINFDSSQTVVQLRIQVTDASNVRILLNQLDSFLETQPLADITVKSTGMGLLWVSIADYIAASQLKGYATVFILIFIFILLAYRSLTVGIYAMVANLAPIIMILGLMGFAGMKLDYLRLLLATIAIGIAVDDTIHLLYRYRYEFDRLGNYRGALEQTILGIGPALVTTTIILVISFLTYLYSDIVVLASFGALLSGAILFALIADLFLLPALIFVFKPFGAERGVTGQ